MTTIRLKPDELELIGQMIDKRDSAHLSGHTADPFSAVALNGGVTAIQFPGRTGAAQTTTLTFQRLLAVDVLVVVSRKGNVTNFDLADGIRDRLEDLKMEAGQPSQLERERAARARPEERQSQLETQIQREVAIRQERRTAFAAGVGRRASLTVTTVLGVVYLAAVVYGLIAAPLVAALLALALGILGLASWLFRIDAFWLSHQAQRQAAARVERWLSRFEADQPDD